MQVIIISWETLQWQTALLKIYNMQNKTLSHWWLYDFLKKLSTMTVLDSVMPFTDSRWQKKTASVAGQHGSLTCTQTCQDWHNNDCISIFRNCLVLSELFVMKWMFWMVKSFKTSWIPANISFLTHKGWKTCTLLSYHIHS